MFAPNGLHKHLFTLTTDQKQIRDLREGYGPRQKAGIRETPALVVRIWLTDLAIVQDGLRFTRAGESVAT
jgi:hypothetical protein